MAQERSIPQGTSPSEIEVELVAAISAALLYGQGRRSQGSPLPVRPSSEPTRWVALGRKRIMESRLMVRS